MKRAFSTVACMDSSYKEVVESAAKAGMSAVEIRQDNDGSLFGLNKEQIPEMMDYFKKFGVAVSDLGTGITVFEYDAEKVKQADKMLEIASMAEAKGIRVFLGKFDSKFSNPGEFCYDGIVKTLKEMCACAVKYGVEIWVETHNAFSTGKVLKKLCEDVACDNMKIIWDIIHSIEQDETPEETVNYIADKIAHIHIKDGVHPDDDNEINYVYTRLGYGELPVAEIISLLKSINYNGYLSLEWEKAWRPEIYDAYENLDEILAAYNSFMDGIENNLLPMISSDKWETVVPKVKKLARFSKGKYNDTLNININSKSYGVGKWVATADVEEGKTYDFSVSAKTEADITDIYVIYTTFRKDGSMILRDHAHFSEVVDGFVRFSDKIEALPDTVSVRIELWLKGYKGEVLWYAPVLRESEERKERKAKIAIGYIPPKDDGIYTIESNVESIIKVIDNSAKKGADLIVLGECMYERGVPKTSLAQYAERDNGSLCTMISGKAKEYNAYIVYNFHENENGEYYNTSVLFDRKGKIVGKYRKTHLTVTEFDEGMTPGDSYPVFETDFGKVGMLICFDHYFSDTAEKIAANGAEIICISSAGDAAEKCIARAMDTGIYLAVCGWNHENTHDWGAGRIVAPDGSILADTESLDEPAFAEIDLNKPVRRGWLSLGPADSEFYGVYKYEKNVHC